MIFVARTRNGVYVVVTAQNEYSAKDILSWALLPKDSPEKLWEVNGEQLQVREGDHAESEHDAHAGALGLRVCAYLTKFKISSAVVRNYRPGYPPPRNPEKPPKAFVVGMGPFDLRHENRGFIATHPNYGEIQIEGVLREKVKIVFASVIATMWRHYKA